MTSKSLQGKGKSRMGRNPTRTISHAIPIWAKLQPCAVPPVRFVGLSYLTQGTVYSFDFYLNKNPSFIIAIYLFISYLFIYILLQYGKVNEGSSPSLWVQYVHLYLFMIIMI